MGGKEIGWFCHDETVEEVAARCLNRENEEFNMRCLAFTECKSKNEYQRAVNELHGVLGRLQVSSDSFGLKTL